MNWKFIFCTLVFSTASVWSDNDTNFKYDMCISRLFKQIIEYTDPSVVNNNKIFNYFIGRDIFECMDRVASGTSHGLFSFHITPAWIAKNTPKYENLRIYTKSVPSAYQEFYRENIQAVIKKDVTINSLEDLRGLKACFCDSEFQRPYGQLKKRGLFKEQYNPSLMVKEIQYRDFAEFFGESCIPNKWSHISEIDTRLKKNYPSLLALCNYNESWSRRPCSSGDELKCLTTNNADIAWTNSLAIKKYLQLPENENYETASSSVRNNYIDPDKYMLLCPDGTKKSLWDKNSCYWQGFPWAMTFTDPKYIDSMENLQNKTKQIIDLLFNKPGKEGQHKNKYQVISEVHTPTEIIQESNYTNVIIGEEIDGYKLRTIDICVRSDVEMALCKVYSATTKVMNIRPAFNCVLKTNIPECMDYVKNKGGITYIDPYFINVAKNKYNLVPVIAENYSIGYDYQGVVGVIKKQSSYKKWEDLKGARICSSGFKSIGEYIAPFNVLRQKGLISNNAHLGSKEFAEFFSGGYCAPEDSHITEHFNQTGCPRSPGRYTNIFKCLTEENGDIAFVKEIHLQFLDSTKKDEEWGKDVSEDDFELFCLDGSRSNLYATTDCSLLNEPPYMFVTKPDQPKIVMDEIRSALADSIDQIREPVREYFDTKKYSNTIIQSLAIHLEPAEKYNSIVEEYNQILEKLNPTKDV